MDSKMCNYIADYINEELARGTIIDMYTIRDAIECYEGDAWIMEEEAYEG